MWHMRSRIAAAAATIFVVSACDARQDEQVTVEPAAEQALIDEATLEALKERYPSLREEPAPEPQPRAGADPTNVPESVRQAAPQKALRSASGEATFYADRFEGRRTASGIPFRQNQMVAAHRAYPFGTLLRVTNTGNGRSANVRVVDRGPFGSSGKAQRTIIDLSRRAAQQLGYIDAGRAQVRVEVLEWGDGLPRATG
jgi:rare lipoprotein A